MFHSIGLQEKDYPDNHAVSNPLERNPDNVMMAGGSVIISPLGQILAGPLRDSEGILTADLDFDDLARGKFSMDVCGHYARNDGMYSGYSVSCTPSVTYNIYFQYFNRWKLLFQQHDSDTIKLDIESEEVLGIVNRDDMVDIMAYTYPLFIILAIQMISIEWRFWKLCSHIRKSSMACLLPVEQPGALESLNWYQNIGFFLLRKFVL